MKRHLIAADQSLRHVRHRSEPALEPISVSGGESGSGGADSAPNESAAGPLSGLPPRPRTGRPPLYRPPSGGRRDESLDAQSSLQSIQALLRRDASRSSLAPVLQPVSLPVRRTTSADCVGRPPLPGNPARLPLLSSASLERTGAERLLADADTDSRGKLAGIVRQARNLRSDLQAEVVGQVGSRVLALLRQSVLGLSTPARPDRAALHRVLSTPTGAALVGARFAPLTDDTALRRPESAASMAGSDAATPQAFTLPARSARDLQNEAELPTAPRFIEGLNAWADVLATTDDPAGRMVLWEKQLQRCAAPQSPEGAATIQRLAGQIADLPVLDRRHALASITGRLLALPPDARCETVVLLSDVIGELDLQARADQFRTLCDVLGAESGPEGNQALLPLVENLQMLAPQHRADRFSFFLQRAEAAVDDQDLDPAFLFGVIGAVGHLPETDIRVACFDALEHCLPKVAPDQRGMPVAAMIDLIEHLPPGDVRWEKFAGMIIHVMRLTETAQPQAIDHLLQVFEHLPEGPHRLAAISHLLLLVRREKKPASVRHLAMIASRIPLVTPHPEMIGVFQCVGQIAQCASEAGRRTVLAEMARTLPQLLRHEQLKQGVLVISRCCATDNERVRKDISAALEQALLRIAFDIERRVIRPGNNTAALRDFSALLDCSAVTPAPIQAKVVSSIMTVVESACRQSSPAFESMRGSVHRMLPPAFVNELERRLARLRPFP